MPGEGQKCKTIPRHSKSRPEIMYHMLNVAVLFAWVAGLLVFGAGNSEAAAANLRNGAVVGAPAIHCTAGDDSLLEIARRYDIGFNAIVRANPDVDIFLPGPERMIVVPGEWILPDVRTREGIVINTAEMRLYFFSNADARTVTTFPVGIGDQGKDTPLGNFSIIEKIKDPSWYVPKSIQREKPNLPPVVPPGPDNPMGSHALRLSQRTVLIHGTNRPWGIGTRNTPRLYKALPGRHRSAFRSRRGGNPSGHRHATGQGRRAGRRNLHRGSR